MRPSLHAMALMAGCALAGLAAGTPAHAIISANVDGIGVNDTIAGKEWLKLTLTANQSYASVIGGFGGYTTTEGFVYATDAQVFTLFSNFGFTQITTTQSFLNAGTTLADDFFSLFGETDPGNNRTQGISLGAGSTYSISDVTYTSSVAGAGSGADAPGASFGTSQPGAIPTIGAFLVRDLAAQDVPEPASLVLLAMGLAGLALVRMNASRLMPRRIARSRRSAPHS